MSDFWMGWIIGAGSIVVPLALLFYCGGRFVARVERELEQERNEQIRRDCEA